MSELLQNFLLTFVPLFIVIDALGNLPFVIAMSEGVKEPERRSMIRTALFTATAVGLVFLIFGKIILSLMNISVGAFAISGGLILLILSIKYISTGRTIEVTKEDMVAVVPIGTPLVVGPATITTLLLLTNRFPVYMVLISFILNMLITWIVFMLSKFFVSFMGDGGLRASSKVFSLLLAAIAVNIILRGIDLLGILDIAGF